MSNYQQLSEAELRTYVKTHPDDIVIRVSNRFLSQSFAVIYS